MGIIEQPCRAIKASSLEENQWSVELHREVVPEAGMSSP